MPIGMSPLNPTDPKVVGGNGGQPPQQPQQPQPYPAPMNLYSQLMQSASPYPIMPQGSGQAIGQAQQNLFNRYGGPQGSGGFAPIRETAMRSFQEEQLPQLLAGYRGSSSGREGIKQRAMERLQRELAGAEGQYNLQEMGQLGQFLQGQQQTALQQQQQGIQGAQGMGNQVISLLQALSGDKNQLLQMLLGNQRGKTHLGLGQGDTVENQGNLAPFIRMGADIRKMITG